MPDAMAGGMHKGEKRCQACRGDGSYVKKSVELQKFYPERRIIYAGEVQDYNVRYEKEGYSGSSNYAFPSIIL